MSFDTLKGQNFIVSTIKTAIETGHIAHSYLFSGPRGVGKTTSARLLAKALCCEKGPTITPCGKCHSCVSITDGSSPDVIEIDGASNTSVDDVRKIKEELMFPPQYSRYKIYIIDEVHMLSNSAFNALLKTIEEPPEWAIFIFATTELQKVPLTVQSRCQCFRFRSIDDSTISELIRNVAKEDGVSIDDESVKWIAKRSRGGARDAYTIFDQCVSFTNGNITFQKIKDELGITGADELKFMIENAIKGNSKEALDRLSKLYESGISAEGFTLDAASYLRDMMLLSIGVENDAVLYNSIEDYDKNFIATLSPESIKIGLERFLNLYRNIKYSLNAKFETESTLLGLRELPYTLSNQEMLRRLELIKKSLVDEAATINPNLLIKTKVVNIGEATSVASTTPTEATSPTQQTPQQPLAEERTVVQNQAQYQGSNTPEATTQNRSVPPTTSSSHFNPFDENITNEPQGTSNENKEAEVEEKLKTIDAMLYQVFKGKKYMTIENGEASIALQSTYSILIANKPQNLKIIQGVLNSVYGGITKVQFIQAKEEEKHEKSEIDSIAEFFEGKVI